MTTNVLIVNRGPHPIFVSEDTNPTYKKPVGVGGYIDMVVYNHNSIKIEEYIEPETVASAEKHVGFVMWFNDAKGFGYIKDDTGEEIFVHFSQINVPGFKTLKEKQIVTFDVDTSGKGKQAVNVQIIGERG